MEAGAADSIDLLRGTSLSVLYALAGGAVGAFTDAVVTEFTRDLEEDKDLGDASAQTKADFRGIMQLALSIAAYGQVMEMMSPQLIDSPVVVSIGVSMLLMSQPRMISDLNSMFMKLQNSLFSRRSAKKVQHASLKAETPSAPPVIPPEAPRPVVPPTATSLAPAPKRVTQLNAPATGANAQVTAELARVPFRI